MTKYYTKEAYDALLRQLGVAEQRHSEALLSMGSGAEADNNTWHDNPAFEQAKQDVDQTRTEVLKLRRLIEDATVVEKGDEPGVGIGSTVLVSYEDGSTMRVHIGGHHVVREASTSSDDLMVISSEAPLGAALMGHEVGETVSFRAPNGRELNVGIVEIQ